MKLLLSFLLLMLPLAVQAQEWQPVVARDLKFRLEMPKPAEMVTAPEIERGQAAPRLAWASKLDDELFDFDYVDYQPGWKRDRGDKGMALDLGHGEAERVFPRDRYKYTRSEPVLLQGFEGYALDIEDPSNGQGIMMRTYVVRDRLYRLLVTHKGDMKTKSAATRFLDSLKLADSR